MKWATIALSILSIARDDARDPLDVDTPPTRSRLAMKRGRSPRGNIAVQRAQQRTLQFGNPSHNFGLIRQGGAARASLPRRMCYHFAVCSPSPDQVRLSNVSK
jgi:hypothetical protein